MADYINTTNNTLPDPASPGFLDGDTITLQNGSKFSRQSGRWEPVRFQTVGQQSKEVPVTATLSDQGIAVSIGEDQVSFEGGLFNPVSPDLKPAASGLTWLWKNGATTTANAGSWWVYVPVTKEGDYAVFGFGTWGIAGAIPHLGRFNYGKIGSCKAHGAASVTKTGTWTTSSLDYAAGGSAAWSSTAGNRISAVVTGHTLVIRSVALTNGGYGVVSIDGDWTAATRLPAFTQADADAGLCRSTDVGKRYIQTGANGLTFPDYHIPLAEGLADTAHTIVVEATGTKPSYTSAARCYVAEFVGCSAADVGQSLAVGTRCIAHIERINDYLGTGASAMLYTPEIEKALATETYEFLGEIHAASTLVGSIVVDVDAVDRSGAAAGSYYSGNTVLIRVVNTLASTDATGTPVAKKSQTLTFSRFLAAPLVAKEKVDWLVDKRVRAGYTAHLSLGSQRPQAGSQALENTRWNQIKIGSWDSVPSDLAAQDAAQHGNVRSLLAVASSTLHTRKAWVAHLDGGAGLDYFSHSGPDNVFVIDRPDGSDKIYFTRSTTTNVERNLAGDSFTYVAGFGVVPH